MIRQFPRRGKVYLILSYLILKSAYNSINLTLEHPLLPMLMAAMPMAERKQQTTAGSVDVAVPSFCFNLHWTNSFLHRIQLQASHPQLKTETINLMFSPVLWHLSLSLSVCSGHLSSYTSMFSLCLCAIVSLFNQISPVTLSDFMHATLLSIVISSVSYLPLFSFDVRLSIGGVLTYSAARYCFSFLLDVDAGLSVPLFESTTLVFITCGSKVWAKCRFFLRWEQNAMDFHFYSKTRLRQLVVGFIRWGEEVIHHNATWERRMRLYWRTIAVIAALQLKLVITNNTLCNASCAQVRQSCEYTRTLILPYAPMQRRNWKLVFGLNGVSSGSITRLCNYLEITIKSRSLFFGGSL